MDGKTIAVRAYTLDEIRRLLDPDRTPYREFERKTVDVIEFLLWRVESLRAELAALRANFAELAGVDLPETGEGDGMV